MGVQEEMHENGEKNNNMGRGTGRYGGMNRRKGLQDKQGQRQ